MTLTIGRASGLLPDSLSMDGDTLSVSGIINGATEDVFKARRQQLLGLVGNEDEPVVPLVYASDDTFDGYYRVSSVQVSPFTMVHNGVGRFSAALERIPGFKSPTIDLVVTSPLRTNGIGLGLSVSQMAWPQTGPIDVGFPTFTRTTETGVVWVANSSIGARSYMSSPANYYNGSVRVEGSYGGTWYPLMGQQGLSSLASVRLNSGLIRLSFSSAAVVTMEIYDGSVWQAATSTFRFDVDANAMSAPSDVRIIRNSPESSTLRVTLVRGFTTASSPYLIVDFTLMRGMPYVEIAVTSSATTLSTRLTTTSVVSATTLAGNGIRHQTANDANGNRLFVGGTGLGSSVTYGDCSYAAIPGTLVTRGYVMGMELDGTSSVAPNTLTNLRDAYFSATAITQRVQVR